MCRASNCCSRSRYGDSYAGCTPVLTLHQLDDAQRDLHDAGESSRRYEVTLTQQTSAFQKQQADIDRRLMIVTQSEISDDAVRRFESSMDKLHRLDVANAYLEMLAEVDKLRSMPAVR